MNLQHLNLKFFVENPEVVMLADFSGIFNSWIQRRLTDDLLVDVADYLHVHNGPGIVLIGHEANYSLDNAAGRLGLLYNRKTQSVGSTQDKLMRAARSALTAARRLEQDHGLKFDGSQMQLAINDRLLAPNTAETLATLEPELKKFFDRLYAGHKYTVDQRADPRERFTIDVKTASRFDLQGLLATLPVEVETTHA